jgi:hypothetical protein
VLLIWRGWGLLAVVALFPLLASCAGLFTVEPRWIAPLAVSLSLLLGGAVCIHCGMRWNCHGTEHSLYFVPLQAWGWVYLAGAGLVALMSVVGGVIQFVKPPPGRPDPSKPDPLFLTIGGALGLVIVVATAWAVVRWARTAPAPSGSEGVGEGAEGDPDDEEARRPRERQS